MLLPDLSLFLLVPILLLYVFLFVKRLLRFGRAFRKRDFLDWKISFFRNFGTNLRFRVRPNFQAILAMTMRDQPMAMNMSFQRSYAERYDWLKNQFKDWAFILTTAILYYMDYDKLSPDQRNVYQQAMATLDGNTPTYHIALYDKPTIVWDLHSLLLGIQLMFSFMLADDENPLRICRNCAKVFVAKGRDQDFCGASCRKLYDARKTIIPIEA